MDLKQLEYFVAVAKLSSLTKAADALYTTQPHVSMVINSLEKELGIDLFFRKSKGVELTEDGVRVYEYAEKTLKDTEMIRQLGRDTGKRWLRLASNPSSYMASLLSDYYDHLNQQDVMLQFSECGIEEMIDRMAKDWYDLGFVFVPKDRRFALKMMAERRHLEYDELFKSGLVLYVGEKHPYFGKSTISSEELVELSFIQADEDYFTLEELLGDQWKGNQENSILNRVISTNSDHLMIQMLESGKVCNLGSYWLREKFKEHNFAMIPVEGYDEKISFGYLKHKDIPLESEALEFLEFLKDQILLECF